MTFAALVEQLAVDARLGPREVRSVLAALLAALEAGVLREGDVLRVPGMGTFYRRRRAARPVRSPTGERMELPALVDVGFRPSKALKRKDVTT